MTAFYAWFNSLDNNLERYFSVLFGLVTVSSAGSSTPSFGQTAATGPIPFGSPGTHVQGFNAVPFGRSLMLCFGKVGDEPS